NKLIDQYAPNIKAFLKSHPDVDRSIRAPDGSIYYIPYVPDGTVARGWFIRQDWLDKLKLKQPQTVEELHTVLKAFKERDPNGNGKADEVPFFARDFQEAYRLVNLWGARSSGSDFYMDFMLDANGKVKHPFAEPAFRDGIRNVAKWYAEGLIDAEIFTRRARAREQLLGTNVGGVTHDWFGTTASFNEALAPTIPGFKFVPMAPPADSNGKRWEEDARLPVRPDGWAITLNNKNPVETIKYFDFYFGRKGRNLANFGVEGVNYDIKGGKPVFRESVLKAKQSVLNQMKDIGAQIPIGFWQDFDYERQWTTPIALAGIDMYQKNKYLAPQFPGVVMNKEERAIYDQYATDVQTYMLEMAQNWVLGAKNVDKTWDEYQAKLQNLGYFQMLTVMQAAYNRQTGKH
ncbi:MAG: sugar transporter permease, partial [Rhodocyclales bacterium]|nr:sugar transporter permease [Rhodocyclales bacterium]